MGERNPLLPAGYAATTVPGLVRAIRDIYAIVAARENVAAPEIRFGDRGILVDPGPNTIAIVNRVGPWGDASQFGAGSIGQYDPLIEAHLWAPEPTIGGDDLENELLRFDQADPMLARFINVLLRVAPRRIGPGDVDPDAGIGEQGRGNVNQHGETYVITFRFRVDVPRDAAVWAAMPDLDADRQPAEQLSPPLYDKPAGTPSSTISIEVSSTLQEPS